MKKNLFLLTIIVMMIGLWSCDTECGERRASSSVSSSTNGNGDSNGTKDSTTSTTIQYTVAYYANGGSGSMSSVNAKTGQNITIAECGFSAPVDKKFDCWNTKQDGTGETYMPNDVVSNLADKAGAIVRLYAIWMEAAAMRIIYKNTKGADNSQNPKSFKESSDITLSNITIDGYIFGGWSDSSADGNVINGWSAGEYRSDVTLYALWTANTYKVEYNANGGTGTMSIQNMTYDVSSALSSNGFNRIGWTMIGWHTDKDASNALYDDGETVSNLTAVNKQTMTLYAIWRANTYTVRYNGNGGAGSMADQNMTYDAESILTANAFSRTGYTFIGWNTDANVKIAIYTDGQTVQNITAYNGTIVPLYAIWQANTYRVQFDKNGGSGDMEDQIFTYDASQDLTECGFTAPIGMKFGSWNVQTDGQGMTYADKATVINLTTTQNGTVKLFAQWIDKSSHRITYNNTKNADNNVNPKSFKESEKVELDDISVVGYSFDGWYYTEIGGDAVTGWNAGERTADVTLWARWTPAEVNYTVKYYFQNVSGDGYEQDLDNYPNLTHSGLTESATNETADDNVTGFDLQAIEQQPIAADGSTVVEIRYNRKTITYTFKADGGNWNGSTNDKTVSGLYGAGVTGIPANPTRIGYNFSGWNSAMPSVFGANNVTWTAQWIANSYIITLSNDGDVSGDTTITATFDSNVPSIQTTPAKAGYTFGGYYAEINGVGTQYIDENGAGIAVWAIADNATLYAAWSPAIVNYTVKTLFQNVDGTDYEQNLSSYPDLIKTALTESVTDETADDNVTGFDLQPIEQQPIAADGSTIVEIKYNRKTVTYTFKANGGKWNDDTTTDKIVSGLYGATVSGVPAYPSRIGYTCSSWINDVPSVFSIDNMTFSLKWSPITYTIKFVRYSGSGTMDNITATYDVPVNLPSNLFTFDRHLWLGWNTDPYNYHVVKYTDEQEVINLATKQDTIVTLYAVWNIGVGDFAYSDGTICPSIYINGKTLIGVVFDTDGTHGKIIHSNEGSEKWCLGTADGCKCNPATSTSDGSNNWQIICNTVSDEGTAGNYPAFEYVNGLGSGWYLPAQDELNQIFINKNIINDNFTFASEKGQIASILQTGYVYISSSSSSNTIVYCHKIGSNNGSYLKEYQGYIRAIRKF